MGSLDSPDRVIDHRPINREVRLVPNPKELTNQELEDVPSPNHQPRWGFEQKKKIFYDRENPPVVEEKEIGRKFDQDKPRWDLLPWAEVEEITEILTFGSQKYEDNNWMYVKSSRKRYFAAMCRHIIAWWKGEKIDSESGKSHLAHAGCCLLFLMWFDNNTEKSRDQKQRK